MSEPAEAGHGKRSKQKRLNGPARLSGCVGRWADRWRMPQDPPLILTIYCGGSGGGPAGGGGGPMRFI